MTAHHGTHSDLHSEQGALRGEHPGRAANPTIKVRDLAWLEFQKPDLAGSGRFAHAFGFTTVSPTAYELQLRGTDKRRNAHRIGQHQDPAHHPHRLRLQILRGGDDQLGRVRCGPQLVRAHRSARRLRSPVQIVAPAVR